MNGQLAGDRTAWGAVAGHAPGRHLRVLGSESLRVADGAAPLIERAVELDAVAAAVSRVHAGEGGVVVLEAGAGLGTTALLDQVARVAAGAGCLVRRAAPGPLERHFQFGVVRALLEAPLREASDDARGRWSEGAAAAAGELLLDGTIPGRDATTMLAHSVLWLCAAIADDQPLTLVVDDAQWSDRSSLEVLSYLARRVADLPLLIAVGARADDPEADRQVLTLLGSAPAATVLHPQRLSVAGATSLIRRQAPQTPVELCRSCHRAAAGNPWLLNELAGQIVAYGTAALEDCELDPPPVSAVARNVVRRRVASLKRRDRAIVEAIAVVGDGAAPHVVATVAGVSAFEFGRARDVLVAAGLLAPGGDRIAHSLVAAAIRDDLPRAARERLHREAARALSDAGAEICAVASQLLQCAPSGDADVSALLHRAAAGAAQRGAPHTAVTYLERALIERAPGDDRSHTLVLLAQAAFDAGLPDVRRRLREALDEVRDRDRRIDVLSCLATLNLLDNADEAVEELIEQELALDADPDTRLTVEIAALDALMMAPERHRERARRVDAIDVSATSDPLMTRVVLAHRAWLAAERGTPGASTCAALAAEALDGDVLLEEVGRRSAFHLCVRTLVMSDRADEARRAIARMRDDAIARGSLALRAGAAWYAAELELRTGRVTAAENEARLAIDLVDDDASVFTGGAVAVLAGALVERGAFAEARDLLDERGREDRLDGMAWEIPVRHARARLWLAEGDFARAHDEACAVGVLRANQGRLNPTWSAWRSTAALALAHLGRLDEAVALAEEELALAKQFGAPVPIVSALHARAVAEADPAARVAICELALSEAANSPALLQSVRVRLELGSALARLGRRIEARGALRPALADADAVGATLLADRARRELVATGLRPRRAALEGPEALTPRQRQICELAAAGKGNRHIAQELFLSIKTVETHLAAGFRKLGVNTRAALAGQLRQGSCTEVA